MVKIKDVVATEIEIDKRFDGTDSDEEVSFVMWLEEMVGAGYIKSWKRLMKGIDAFSLSDDVMLKKSGGKQHKILRAHEYSPDFRIVWCKKAYGIFVNDLLDNWSKDVFFISDENVSYVEVKPSFDENNMTRLFKINQKWVWEKHGIYVNLVIREKLFGATFTPNEYLTLKSGKQRKISKWIVRGLGEFVKKVIQ